MIKIGYLGSPGTLGLEYLPECKPTPIKLLGGNLTRCPSVRGYHQNTFEVKCPFDLEWTVTKHPTKRYRWEINQNKTTIDMSGENLVPEILRFDKEGKVVQVLINPGWSFVSDTPNTIMLQHSNGIDTNPQIVTGQVDIYKWPDRRLSVAYSLENDKDEQTFTLKRGQPWYRITFFLPDLETVKLVRMEERPEFLKRTRNKSDLTVIKYLNWRKIFTEFGNTRPKKLIP